LQSLQLDHKTLKLYKVQVTITINFNKLIVVIGVMALLRPLLLDNVPSIQQSAALALGRLANYSDELAEAVVSNEILPQLVYSLSE
jgi:hypothetical protein